MADAYRGVFGAIPYAFRATESLTMRAYAALGALAAAFATLLFTSALVVWMAETVSAQGGTFLFSRSLFVVAGLATVGPLLAPILFVARRHRRGDRVAATYDRWMGVTGFLFLVSLFVALVISTPQDLQQTESAVVGALYALPQLAGFVPPVASALAIFATHFRLRGGADDADAVTDGDAATGGGKA